VRSVVVAAALLCAAAPAAAIEYELPIDIDSEEDLYELYYSQEISEDTFNALIDLLRRGVDVGKADAEELYALPGLTVADVDAIITYRAAAGTIFDPGALAAAGVISDEKLAAIAPFVIVGPIERPGAPAFAGRARYRALYSSGDSRLPAMALEARATTLRRLNLAVDLVVTRNLIGDLRYDAGRDALSAAGRTTRVHVPKAYAFWKTPGLEVVAGSYTAGFGQRLTFDETTMYTPNGIYPDATIQRDGSLVRDCIESTGELGVTPCPADSRRYVTPDYDWRESLLGLGVSARKIPAGKKGWFQLTGWGSAEMRDIYQYELYDRGRCADPTNDDDSDCDAPDVFHRMPDPLEPSPEFSFQTLSDVWAELLGGANVSWFSGRRGHIGITGWGANPYWLVNGIALDFQEWSRWPRGGGYGAIGADASFGLGLYDLGVEVTRSFDGITGGDFGAVVRATTTWYHNELELSARWYGKNFVNPHTGAIAEPDELDGQRARDEAGVRVRYGGQPTRRWSVRALADAWITPSSTTPKTRVEARADYIFNRDWRAGGFARWSDKDLRESGFGLCHDITREVAGEPVPCTGQKISVGALAIYTPRPKLTVKAQGQLAMSDDPAYSDRFRMDVLGWLGLTWWVTDDARLRARVAYEKPDLGGQVTGISSLEHSIWGYLQLSYRLPRQFMISGRYEMRAYLSEGQYPRDPSPEHWLSLEVEARF
jgi:hypothetical protein